MCYFGVACTKAGDNALQAICEGFDSLRLHLISTERAISSVYLAIGEDVAPTTLDLVRYHNYVSVAQW
jgi:hypothetical protein